MEGMFGCVCVCRVRDIALSINGRNVCMCLCMLVCVCACRVSDIVLSVNGRNVYGRMTKAEVFHMLSGGSKHPRLVCSIK